MHIEERLFQRVQEAIICFVAAAHCTAVTSMILVDLCPGTGDLSTGQATQGMGKDLILWTCQLPVKLAATLKQQEQ